MPVFKKSRFYDGLIPEQFSFITGINQTVEDKTLIKPHTRYIMAATDYSQGISLRKLGLSTDGLGYGRLPYDGTGIYSGFARGMGIFQLQGNASNFSTYFTEIFPTSSPYPSQSASSWDQWAFNSTTRTNIATYSGRASSPVGIQLPCKVFLNGIDILTDFMQMQGAWNISGTTTSASLIQQGIAPTLPSTTGTGLTGYYAWCYTFVDSNGNESQPSPLVASAELLNVSQNVTVTPTGITQGVWATIRLYRTISNTSTVLASSNPTFYHVPGLDTTVTGASSYTITDGVADTTLELPTNYQLTNVNYANGILQSLSTSAVPKFIVGWNNALWGGYWDISGTDYPTTVYFSASVDNSQLSTGNATSWNSLNFINVGTLDDGKIIGMYPGLQGRLYVFKEFSTYIIQPTGNASLPYSSTPISGEFGLYHHSIAEIGGAVIGRAKDGIYSFNGSTYKLLTYNIYKSMNQFIFAEADSGAYDSAKERYYLSVCDSTITNSYQTQVFYGSGPTQSTSIINCLRNTVLVYDANTQSWEIHANNPIQVFGKLKDTSGREKIFALGVSGDIFVLVDGNCQGSSFSFLASYSSSRKLIVSGFSTNNPGIYAENFIFCCFSISSDGNIQFFDFKSVVLRSLAHDEILFIETGTDLPINDSTVQIMILIPNNLDTVSSASGSSITFENNLYQKTNCNNYSFSDLTNENTYMTNSNGISTGSQPNNTNQFGLITGSISPVPSTEDEILVVPYRYFPNYASSEFNQNLPFFVFMTPPMGIRLNDMANKFFQMFRMQIKGSGTLNIWGFKNGNETYQFGPALCTPDETHSFIINSSPTTLTTDQNTGITYPNSYQQMVYLNGLVCYYERFMIWMVKGTGWFEIQDFTGYYRLQSETDSI